MTDQDTSSEVGSLAEEAAKLFGALSDWAQEHRPDLSDLDSPDLAGLADHVAAGGVECTYCPVCRLVRAMRDTSPEVKAHLASAAGSMLQAVAGLLATPTSTTERDPGDGVEHIPLDDDLPDGGQA